MYYNMSMKKYRIPIAIAGTTLLCTGIGASFVLKMHHHANRFISLTADMIREQTALTQAPALPYSDWGYPVLR